jgi:hypothetical protein
MGKFDYLNIPDQWNQYFTKYPQGYTILEALLNWVQQVDDMVDNVNDWNVYLDDFVKTFDTELQEKVTEVLTQWKADGTLADIINHVIFDELNSKIDASGVIPKIIVPETDYTAALNRAVASLSVNGGSIIIPQGVQMDFSSITISKKNITIKGEGILNGTIVVNAEEDYTLLNFKLEGVRLINANPLEIKKGKGIRLHKGLTFENSDKAIFVNPPETGIFHGVSMVYTMGCHFKDVNYGLYVAKPANSVDWLANDFIFTNNIINTADVEHVHIEEIDGIVIDNNTMFFPSYNVAPANKRYNVYIKKSDWATITNNQLFEAGWEGIYLEDAKHFTVDTNRIAWAGQRQPSSGIKVTYSIEDSPRIAMGQITNNNISKATRHGVEIENTSYVQSVGNTIECSLVNDQYYYGTIDVATQSHYGTFLAGANIDKIVSKNILVNVKETNIDKNTFSPESLDITDTTTALNTATASNFNLVQPSATTINAFNGGFNGKRIKLLAFNANTTILQSSAIQLHNSKSAVIPNNGIMVFEYYSGVWREVHRNFDTEANVIYADINTAVTGLDAKANSQFNMIMPSPSTIVNIDNGVNFKEITLIAFNGNTTIANNSTIGLTTGANVTMANGSLMKLRFYAGKWYQI